jgi:putative ABC transport system substrate-binding protein
MRRREVLAALGLPILTRGAVAQRPNPARRIAVPLGQGETNRPAKDAVDALSVRLGELGWRLGEDVAIATHWATAAAEIDAHAADIVRAKPDVIVALSTLETVALKKHTKAIPIVFALGADPIGYGFVENLARPGGNITGFIHFEFTMGGKWLELLLEMAPATKRVVVVIDDPEINLTANWLANIRATAPSGLELAVVALLNQNVVDPLVTEFPVGHSTAMLVVPALATTTNAQALVDIAARREWPAIYPFSSFVALRGGLMSYGVNTSDQFRRVATYVDRILRGESPASLPVQIPTKLELTINLKVASALRLKVPQTLLTRADEVIE